MHTSKRTRTTPTVDALNDLGAQGWELVAFDDWDRTVGLNAVIDVLERPMQGEPLSSPR
jgi:hypothetical protein